VKKWAQLQLASGAYAHIEPLEPHLQSAMSRHEVPKDLMAFIFALVSLADAAATLRQLKLSALPNEYCGIVGCFPLLHEHGVSIPKDARPQTRKTKTK
jgi:hypothetical protein